MNPIGSIQSHSSAHEVNAEQLGDIEKYGTVGLLGELNEIFSGAQKDRNPHYRLLADKNQCRQLLEDFSKNPQLLEGFSKDPNERVTVSSHLAATRADPAETLLSLLIDGYDHQQLDSKLDKRGWNMMSFAVDSGNPACVRVLLRNRADVNCEDGEGLSPLFRALNVTNTDVLRELLSHRGGLSHLGNSNIPDCKGQSFKDALKAKLLGRIHNEKLLNIAKEFFSAKEIEDIKHQQKIIYAKDFFKSYSSSGLGLSSSHLESNIKVLRDAGLLDDIVKEAAPMLVYRAVESKNVDVLNIILNTVPLGKINQQMEKEGYTPLILAAKNGSTDCVKALLDKKALPDEKDNKGYTALAWAIMVNAVNVARLLLGLDKISDGRVRVANIEAVDHHGRTPLIMACQGYGHDDMVDTLLKAGANVEATDETGKTPLMIACGADASLETIKALLAAGANINATDATGKTPLLLAAGNKSNVNALVALLDQGFYNDIDETDSNGRSALMIAAATGNYSAVLKLLDKGASMSLTSAGQTALDFAVEGGSEKVISALTSAAVKSSIAGQTPPAT